MADEPTQQQPEQPAPTEEPPVPSEPVLSEVEVVEGKPEEEKPAEEKSQPEQTEQPEEIPVTPSETQTPQPPESPQPQVNIEEEVKKKLDEKVLELLKRANEVRKQRREDNLNKILDLARKKEINNQNIRDLLHVSKSTAAQYLSTLVKNSKLKMEKKGRATVYKT